MGNTWRYVTAARGHLTEVYEQLLGEPLCRIRRVLTGRHPDPSRLAADIDAANAWGDKRIATLMAIVDVLNRRDVRNAIANWQSHAIAFLKKSPSARSRQKFEDEGDRILFLCVVLWYARVAIEWLEERENEGLLQGGMPYREMTAQAARFGALRTPSDLCGELNVLPEESWIVDELDEGDSRLEAYQKWTYIADMEDF